MAILPGTNAGALALTASLFTLAMGGSDAPTPSGKEVAMTSIDGIWNVEFINEAPLDEDVQIRFQIDGESLSGGTDCTFFNAEISRSGDGFLLGPMKQETKECSASQQEADHLFFRALEQANGASEGNSGTLILTSGGTAVIRASLIEG